MSEELETPRGRVLHPVKRRNKPDVTEWRGDPLQVWRIPSGRFTADFDEGMQADFDTMGEALDWLDARADETVAALLPPGSLVTTEERVREAARALAESYAADTWGLPAKIDALLSALRAGAKS